MLEENRPFPDIVLVDRDGAARRFSELPAERGWLVVLAPPGSEPFLGRISSRLAEIRIFNAEPLVIETGAPLELTETPPFPVVRPADPWLAWKELGMDPRVARMVTIAVVDRAGNVRKIYREPVDRLPSMTTLLGWLGFLDRNA